MAFGSEALPTTGSGSSRYFHHTGSAKPSFRLVKDEVLTPRRGGRMLSPVVQPLSSVEKPGEPDRHR